MYIEKHGKEYVASGEGLVATGKSHYQALCNLLNEIYSMRDFYHDIFGDDETYRCKYVSTCR